MSSREDREELDRWDDEEDEEETESIWERNGYRNEADYWSERL